MQNVLNRLVLTLAPTSIHHCVGRIVDDLLFHLPQAQGRYVTLAMKCVETSTNSSSTVKSASLEPWFPQHVQRDIYLSLLHINPEDADEKTPQVPITLIKAALVRRAVEDIRRIIQIRTAKQALGTLLARGSIGDDLWQRFVRAEKEMEDELRDVVMEVCVCLTRVKEVS